MAAPDDGLGDVIPPPIPEGVESPLDELSVGPRGEELTGPVIWARPVDAGWRDGLADPVGDAGGWG